MVGGIGRSGCVTRDLEALELDVTNICEVENGLRPLYVTSIHPPVEHERPLLCGHSMISVASGKTLILGGGAVCFSFGSYWNDSLWVIQHVRDASLDYWKLLPPQIREAGVDVNQLRIGQTANVGERNPSHTTPAAVDRKRITTAAEFNNIIEMGQPCILEGLDFGACTERWSNAYLKEAIGCEREVIIHEASSSMMSFHQKDFKYVTKAFGEFLDMAEQGANVYLRSLSMKSKSDLPTLFHEDFPGISSDFRIRVQLNTVSERLHSSPFRISTAGSWLHYDVQANCLFQIRGSKKLILFPPEDMLRLQFPPGSTTSALSIFQPSGALCHIEGTQPVEVCLHTGDVLFIPPLWPHTAAPVQGVSVAINAFFRSLNEGYAAGRDVYGNRDLQAYENGRKQIEKMVNSFAHVPPALRRIYLRRLADELLSRAIAKSER